MARTNAGHLPPVTVHLETPSIARVYDYYLGGNCNWAVDREFGRQVLERYPIMRHLALIHRVFLNRVVKQLMARGVRQFLDIGSGIPGAGSTHQVADAFGQRQTRQHQPRVIYVDNDPVAVGHAELLLNDEGDPRRHVIIDADLRDPDALWQQVVDTGLFDLDQPVALLLIAVLHLQQPDIDGNEIGPESARRLRSKLPDGSYVAVSHVATDGLSPEVSTALAGLKDVYDASGSGPVTWRSRTEIEAMLSGLELLEPGWTRAVDWGAETGPTRLRIPPSSCDAVWAGVGRTPLT